MFTHSEGPLTMLVDIRPAGANLGRRNPLCRISPVTKAALDAVKFAAGVPDASYDSIIFMGLAALVHTTGLHVPGMPVPGKAVKPVKRGKQT